MLKINNSSLSVDKYNDSEGHFTALVDENHQYSWLWYKIELYQLLLAMATVVVRPLGISLTN